MTEFDDGKPDDAKAAPLIGRPELRVVGGTGVDHGDPFTTHVVPTEVDTGVAVAHVDDDQPTQVSLLLRIVGDLSDSGESIETVYKLDRDLAIELIGNIYGAVRHFVGADALVDLDREVSKMTAALLDEGHNE